MLRLQPLLKALAEDRKCFVHGVARVVVECRLIVTMRAGPFANTSFGSAVIQQPCRVLNQPNANKPRRHVDVLLEGQRRRHLHRHAELLRQADLRERAAPPKSRSGLVANHDRLHESLNDPTTQATERTRGCERIGRILKMGPRSVGDSDSNGDVPLAPPEPIEGPAHDVRGRRREYRGNKSRKWGR